MVLIAMLICKVILFSLVYIGFTFIKGWNLFNSTWPVKDTLGDLVIMTVLYKIANSLLTGPDQTKLNYIN